MNNFCIGIIGNNYKKTTMFVEDIIKNTKAKKDQDNIKMNIVINKNLNKDNIKEIILNLEKCNSNYLCLYINDDEIYEYAKEISNIPIIDLNNNDLINDIITLHNRGDNI